MSSAEVGNMQCPNTATPCAGSSALTCHNGGVCCQTQPTEEFCACPKGYSGKQCLVKDDFYELLESRDETLKMIGLSSIISIVVGIIALIALGVIALVIIRNLRKRRPWGFGPLEKEPDLDTTIIYVQEEISKLSTVQQLNKLHRLSKLFEKTVREAILSEPGHSADRPKSVVMNEHLPRWSSAPACINRPPNELDTVDGDDVFVDQKPRYETLFSHQAPMQSHRFTSHL